MDLERIQALLSALLYPQPGLRSRTGHPGRQHPRPAALWAYGISGDYPILLVRMREEEDWTVNELLRRILTGASAAEDRPGDPDHQEAGYNQELRDQIHRLLAQPAAEIWLNQRGGIFILYTPQMPEADRILLTAARVVIDPAVGTLPMQIEALRRPTGYLPAFRLRRSDGAGQGAVEPLSRPDGLLFDNGLGGFSARRPRVRHLPRARPATRRRPGSMWWPTPSSASWYPSPAAATPGR